MRVDKIRKLTTKYPWLAKLDLSIRITALEDIQTLLTSLEKEKEARAKAEWEGGWAIDPEYYVPKSELKKEKERADRAEKKFSSIYWYQEYIKAEERAEGLVEAVNKYLGGEINAPELGIVVEKVAEK